MSDDNPFSKSQFKTLKYRPEFPQRFGCRFQSALHQVELIAGFMSRGMTEALDWGTAWEAARRCCGKASGPLRFLVAADDTTTP